MEVRAVYRNQDQPILTRMMDKESHWGYDNGLQEICLDFPVSVGFSRRRRAALSVSCLCLVFVRIFREIVSGVCRVRIFCSMTV